MKQIWLEFTRLKWSSSHHLLVDWPRVTEAGTVWNICLNYL